MRHLILLFVLLTSTQGFAQQLQWSQTKGPGGNCSLFFDSLGTMYAANGERILYSTDEGLSWTDMTPPNSGTFSSVSVSPEGVLFVGEGTVAATTQTHWNLYRTSDKGETWDILLSNFKTTEVHAVGKDSVFLLGGYGSTYSIRVSADNGTTWSSLPPSNVLPKHRAYLSITHQGDLFVYYDSFNDPYLYRSTDRGQNWTKLINQAMGGSLFSNPTTGSLFTVAGYIYRSEDNGRTWSKVNHPYGGGALVGMGNGDLYTMNMIYGQQLVMHRSTNEGATWVKIKDTMMYAYGLAVNRHKSTLYIYPGPLLVANDMQFQYRPVPCAAVSALMAHPDGTIRSPLGVTTDGGDTWSRLRVSIAPYHSGTFVRFGMDSSGGILARSGDEFARSTDGGSQWTLIKPGLATKDFVTAPNGSIFVLHETQGVYRTTDLGGTWDMFNSFGTRKLRSITCNAAGSIFLGADGAIFRSTTNGETWEQIIELLDHKNTIVPLRLSYVSMNRLLHTSKGVLVAAFDAQQITDSTIKNGIKTYQTVGRNGILFSTDDGVSWKEMNTGLLNDNVSQIVSGPSGELFALSHRPGVGYQVIFLDYNSPSWIDVNAGLPNTYDLLSITVGHDGTAYVGTAEQSVFKLVRPASVTRGNADLSLPTITIHPNPVKTQTTISYTLTDSRTLKLDVCDVLGRVLVTYTNGVQPAGEHTITADLSAFEPGMYFLRCVTDRTVEMRKIFVAD